MNRISMFSRPSVPKVNFTFLLHSSLSTHFMLLIPVCFIPIVTAVISINTSNWIDSAQGRDCWSVLVNLELNRGVSYISI